MRSNAHRSLLACHGAANSILTSSPDLATFFHSRWPERRRHPLNARFLAQGTAVMKRDIDLARQLLLDIENRGADCSVSVLRPGGANHEAEERLRYHLRLLIDAGLLKEIDRTTGGVPCVRLTDAGHETIELTRDESRWREAMWECQERTGGMSLTVVRGVLLQWALDGPSAHPAYPQGAYPRRRYAAAPPALVEGRYRGRRSPYRFEPYIEESHDRAIAEDVRYVRVRPAYRNGWHVNGVDAEAVPAAEREVRAVLPEFLI